MFIAIFVFQILLNKWTIFLSYPGHSPAHNQLSPSVRLQALSPSARFRYNTNANMRYLPSIQVPIKSEWSVKKVKHRYRIDSTSHNAFFLHIVLPSGLRTAAAAQESGRAENGTLHAWKRTIPKEYLVQTLSLVDLSSSSILEISFVFFGTIEYHWLVVVSQLFFGILSFSSFQSLPRDHHHRPLVLRYSVSAGFIDFHLSEGLRTRRRFLHYSKWLILA